MCSAFSLKLTHSHCIPVLHCKDTSVRFLFCLEWRQSKFEVKNRRTGNIEDILSWPGATSNLSSVSLCLSAKAWNRHGSVIGRLQLTRHWSFDTRTFFTINILPCFCAHLCVCVVACVLVSLIHPAVDLFLETAASSVISGEDVGQSFYSSSLLMQSQFSPTITA